MRLKRHVKASRLGPRAMRVVAWATVKRRGGMDAEEVVRVLDALEAAGLRSCLAGGWGVDALMGRQRRAHADIDVVLDTAEEGEARACDALAALGYRMVEERDVPGLWMPRAVSLDAARGGHVQLLTLNRGLVASALGLAGREDASSDDPLLREGAIAGRTVACLAPAVQLLMHGGYPARRQDRFDMAPLAAQFPEALAALKGRGARAADVAARVMFANLVYQHDLAIAVWRETEECTRWVAAGHSADDREAPGRPEMPRLVSDCVFGEVEVRPG